MEFLKRDRLLYKLNGIRFKTWLYFFVLTVTILSILFFIQVFSFAAYYQRRQRENVERVGDAILEAYLERRGNNFDFKRQVLQTESTTDVEITLFNIMLNINGEKIEVDEESFLNILTLPRYGGEPVSNEMPAFDEDFFQTALKNAGDGEIYKFVYASYLASGSYMVYGSRVLDFQDGEVFLYAIAPLEISDFTLSVLRRQSVFSTIVCAALSILLSWLVSNRIARPVTDFSKSAQKLAKGDYSVRFVGNGLSEIELLADTLNYATEEIAKSDRFRRELLANVSHDLRTPLTMVKAYAEMIRDISGSDKQKRISHSQTIIDEADRLAMLVSDIQNISKLQSGTDPIEKTMVDMSALVRQVLERFDIYAQTEGYIFKSEIEPNLEVFGDEKKLEQVLYNLIGNAVNYTGEDKTVTICLKEEECPPPCDATKPAPDKTTVPVKKKVLFKVTDTGKGIQKDEIDSVWERYYRASQSKRRHVGTGLGLSIVKNILILHEAEYGVESEIGKGSEFWFRLLAAER